MRYTVELDATVLYCTTRRNGEVDMMMKQPAVHWCFELGDKGVEKQQRSASAVLRDVSQIHAPCYHKDNKASIHFPCTELTADCTRSS